MFFHRHTSNPNPNNKIETKLIIDSIVLEILAKTFLEIQSEEEFRRFGSESLVETNRRLRMCQLELQIQKFSRDNQGMLKNRIGVILDFKGSVKEFCQKYFRDSTEEMAKLADKIEIVPTLSVMEVDEQESGTEIVEKNVEDGYKMTIVTKNLLTSIKQDNYFC